MVDNISNDCCICLENLKKDFPVRIYGTRCFHDIHLKCLKDLKNKGDFPCCLGSYNLTSHANITDVYFSKLQVNVFGKHCVCWKDTSKVKNALIMPESIIDLLTLQHPSFVRFRTTPFDYTVKSYHVKWLSKNKVNPL